MSEPAWLPKLKQLAEKNSLAVLQFDEDDWDQLSGSRRGGSEFTITTRHRFVADVRKGMLCLIHGRGGNTDMRFGFLSSKAVISTIDSRIKVRRAIGIEPKTIASLINLLTEKAHSTGLRNKLSGDPEIAVLGPKLSAHLIERLASLDANHGPMRNVAEMLQTPKYFRDAAAMEEDALKTAMSVFGLSSGYEADELSLAAGSTTAISRVPLLEDNVVEYDARYVPGYEVLTPYMTGRAVFSRGVERLEVYTANKRPLEELFGVDLIYMNLSKQSIVMLQYKMLERVNDDWLYRPDKNFKRELARMQKFQYQPAASGLDYRLNPSAFYFKFVKRDGMLTNPSIVVSLDHLDGLLQHEISRGPRGGLRISYENLSGRYLHQSGFVDLVRSGYIGSHAETTAHLRALIEAVLKGNRAVVTAIQSAARSGMAQNGEDDGDDDEPVDLPNIDDIIASAK